MPREGGKERCLPSRLASLEKIARYDMICYIKKSKVKAPETPRFPVRGFPPKRCSSVLFVIQRREDRKCKDARRSFVVELFFALLASCVLSRWLHRKEVVVKMISCVVFGGLWLVGDFQYPRSCFDVCFSVYALAVQYVRCAKQAQMYVISRTFHHLRRRRHVCSPCWRLCSAWRIVSSSRLARGHNRSIADALLQGTNLERAQRNAMRMLAMSPTNLVRCTFSLPVPIASQAVQ